LSTCKKPEDFEKRAKAIAHDMMVENLVLSLLHDMENGADYDALIENPVGSLRRRPYMNTAAVQSQFNRTPTDHCAFSEHIRSVPASQQTQKQAQPQKPTDYWHTLDWCPRGNTGDGRCHGRCGQGEVKAETGGFQHDKVIGGDGDRSLKGPEAKQLRQQIPYKATVEVLEALMKKEKRGKIVLDLFSGGESWKRAAEEKDYQYVGVDIRSYIQKADEQSN
jgi:hypothetical protein